MKLKLSFCICFLLSFSFYGQLLTTIKGKVFSKEDESIVNTAMVTIPKSNRSVLVNDQGEFVLESWQNPPLQVKVSAVGFKDYYYTLKTKKDKIQVFLEEEITSLNEIVVSASRTPEHVFESPVSIETFSATAIENNSSANFFDGLENLKGVNVNSSSYGFKSVNTRGFASLSNVRFVQLVDGMDNASPSLNFSVGNLVGLNDLDVQSIEILPGASSALYGANAFNGIMFMKSKSPFKHEGASVYGKTGVTSAENSGTNEFYDIGLRVAKKVKDNLALKLTASYFNATDWFATDTRNTSASGRFIEGTRELNSNYNGANVYGDEFARDGVSRTGYNEADLVDYTTDSFKTSFSAHF